VQLRLAVYFAFAAVASLLQPAAASATESAPTVTFVDGTSTIISGPNGYLPAAGVRLRKCDIIRTGPQALVQVELEDGGMIVLGPDSRFLFGLPYAGEPVVGPNYLLSGWAKIVVPKREKALPYRARTPYFDMLIESGAVVMRVSADGGQFFVEQGGAVAQASAGKSVARVNVGAGRTYSRKQGQESGAVTDGVDAVLAKSLPRSLRDTPPSMLARLKDRAVEPKPASDDIQADVAQWKKSVREFRSCFVDVDVRGAQEALQRIGFDVGQVDGVLGPRTQTALREFQQQRGLATTGELDIDTMRALDVAQRR
jgi:hypothetical protein